MNTSNAQLKTEIQIPNNVIELVKKPVKSNRKNSLSMLREDLVNLSHCLHYPELLETFNELEKQMNNLVLTTSEDDVENKKLAFNFNHESNRLLVQAIMTSADSVFILDGKMVVSYFSDKKINKSSASWKMIPLNTWLEEIQMIFNLSVAQSKLLTKSKFYEYANDIGRCFTVAVTTPDLDLDRKSFGKIQHQLKYRLQASDIKSEKIKYIDLLINSLAGNKDENELYIKEWLAWSIFHPEDNANLPALNIYGAEGTGKGILSEHLLPTIVCKSSVATINLSNFNAQLEGASYCILNELTAASKDRDAVKQLIGATTHRVEKKGVDAFMVEASSCFLMFSNSEFASAYLSRNRNENRRFSIINCEYRLDDIIGKHFGDENEFLPKEEIQDIIKNVVKACDDRETVSSWLTELKTFLPKTMPSALHGNDYNNLFDTQADIVETVMDCMLEVSDTLPQNIITEVLKAVAGVTNSKVNAPKTYKNKIKAYAKSLNLIFHNRTGGEDNRLIYKGLEDKNVRVAGYSKPNTKFGEFDIKCFYDKCLSGSSIKNELIVNITDSI
ncbi:MAG: hypothetical protein ACI88H_000682 [Cocleimonas sp.]|jgi:hypothetical protein